MGVSVDYFGTLTYLFGPLFRMWQEPLVKTLLEEGPSATENEKVPHPEGKPILKPSRPGTLHGVGKGVALNADIPSCFPRRVPYVLCAFEPPLGIQLFVHIT